MAAGPARAIRFIHRALIKDIETIERMAHDAKTTADIETVRTKFDFFAHVLHLHTSGEEVAIFPALAAKVGHVIPLYLLDHEEDRALVDRAKKALSSGEDVATISARSKRACALLAAHIALHVKKEEELLVPLLEEHFTPAEQGEQVGKMMATFPPPDMQAVLPWMVELLSPEDRVAYMGVMKAAVPPDRYAIMHGWIKAKLGDATPNP
jgi:hemerythrin-like domain-containing protein